MPDVRVKHTASLELEGEVFFSAVYLLYAVSEVAENRAGISYGSRFVCDCEAGRCRTANGKIRLSSTRSELKYEECGIQDLELNYLNDKMSSKFI